MTKFVKKTHESGKVKKDQLKSPHQEHGFAGGECYPGNNDYYSLGLKNKSPKVSGNIKLSAEKSMRGERSVKIAGPFGSYITLPDAHNHEGAAKKEKSYASEEEY
jgi:hypothetical protein